MRQLGEPLIVELCGVAGGGKSVLVGAYVAEFPEESELATLPMERKVPTVFYSFLYLIRHPISFWWVCMYIISYHVRGLFWYSFHLGLRACAKYARASFSKKRIVFIDEGIMHVLITASGRECTQKEMDRWLTRFTIPDVVVLVRTGDFHRFHNEHAAKHPRVRQGASVLNAWERVVRVQTKMLEAGLNTKGVHVWAVPPKEDFTGEENARTLHMHLLSTLS